MNNKIGIAALIGATAMLITAIATAVTQFLSFKWAVRMYKPVEKVVEKAEPMMNKMVAYADKALDNYLEELED